MSELSNLITKAEHVAEKVITTVEHDFTWLKDKGHQTAILNVVADIANYGVEAIPIIENLASVVLSPGQVAVLDSIGTAAQNIGVKLENFSAAPSIQTFVAIGGNALKVKLAQIIPSLSNGVKIGGQVVKDVQTLNAIDPTVFQAIVHANISAYINSAGNVDTGLQNFLTQLANQIAAPVSIDLGPAPAPPPSPAPVSPAPVPVTQAPSSTTTTAAPANPLTPKT